MKMNRIIFPLLLALVATLATTGCKSRPPKITPIPGPRPQPVTDMGDSATRGLPYDPNAGGLGTGPGTTPTSEGWDLSQMNQDRGALAAFTIHFSFDSAAVKNSEQSKLDAVVAALNNNMGDKLLIEGHCDERGTEEYNRALGERRALAAREALAKSGVSPDRIRTISYGKDKPEDPSHDESAWAKNRRADFILLHPKGM
jgi:peptidoglycan-associated lipoprotein